MIWQNTEHSISIKISAIVLACLFLINTLVFALPETDALSPQHIFAPINDEDLQDIGFLKGILRYNLVQNNTLLTGNKNKAIPIENNSVFKIVEFQFAKKTEIRKNGYLVPCLINRKKAYYAYITQSPHNPDKFNITIYTKADYEKGVEIKHRQRSGSEEKAISALAKEAKRKAGGIFDVTIADVGLDAGLHEEVVNRRIRELASRGDELINISGLEGFEIHVIGNALDIYIDEETGQHAHAGGISTVGSKNEVKRLWIARGYYDQERKKAIQRLRHESVELNLWWQKTKDLLASKKIRAPDDAERKLPTIREWIAKNAHIARSIQGDYHWKAELLYPATGRYRIPDSPGDNLQRLLLEVTILEKCEEIDEKRWQDELSLSQSDMVWGAWWAINVEEFAKKASELSLKSTDGDVEKATQLIIKLLNEIKLDVYSKSDEHWHDYYACYRNDAILEKLGGDKSQCIDKYEWMYSRKLFDDPLRFRRLNTSFYWRSIRKSLVNATPVVSRDSISLKFASDTAPARYLLEELDVDIQAADSAETIDGFTLISFKNPQAKLLCYDSYPLSLLISRGSHLQEIDLLSGLGDEVFENTDLYSKLVGKRAAGKCAFDIFDITPRDKLFFQWNNYGTGAIPYLADTFSATHEFTQAFLGTIQRDEIKATDKILDLGCGSGIVAIDIAMRKGAPVDAVDINPYAVVTTRGYAARMGIAHLIKAWQSDALSNVKDKYDKIYFNAPHVRAKHTSSDIAVEDADGKLLESVFKNLSSHLAEGGYMQMMINPDAPVNEMAFRYGLVAKLIKQGDRMDYVIYKITSGTPLGAEQEKPYAFKSDTGKSSVYKSDTGKSSADRKVEVTADDGTRFLFKISFGTNEIKSAFTIEAFRVTRYGEEIFTGYVNVIGNTMRYGFPRSEIDEIISEDGGPKLAAIGTTSPDYSGVGRALMILARQIVREKGYTEFKVFEANDDAVKFYRDLGFEGDRYEMTSSLSSQPEIKIRHKGSIANCIKDLHRLKALKTIEQLIQIRRRSETTVRMELKMLEGLGLLIKESGGVKGDPYKYGLSPLLKGLSKKQIKEICDMKVDVEGKQVKILNRYEIPVAVPLSRVQAKTIEVVQQIIHRENLDTPPEIPQGKVLWHVFVNESIPEEQQKMGIITQINQASNRANGSERIRILNKNEKLEDVLSELSQDPNNIVHVVLNDEKRVNEMPKGVKMAVVKGELGNYAHLHGAMAISRALTIRDRSARNEKLRTLYKLLTGEKFTGVIPDTDDPKALALAIIFNLPKIIIADYEELRQLNRSLISLIQSA